MEYSIRITTNELGMINIIIRKDRNGEEFDFNIYSFNTLVDYIYKDLEKFKNTPILKEFLKDHNGSYGDYHILINKVLAYLTNRLKEKEEELGDTWKSTGTNELRKRLKNCFDKFQNRNWKEIKNGSIMEKTQLVDLINQAIILFDRLNTGEGFIFMETPKNIKIGMSKKIKKFQAEIITENKDLEIAKIKRERETKQNKK